LELQMLCAVSLNHPFDSYEPKIFGYSCWRRLAKSESQTIWLWDGDKRQW